MKRLYPAKLYINGRKVDQVVIDPHYEIRHGKEMSDDLILELVGTLGI